MPNLNFFLGEPLQFRQNIYVFPPTVRDSLQDSFHQFVSLLTTSQEEIEDIFEQQLKDDKDFIVPTPFEFIFLNAYNNNQYEKIAQEAFKFFIKKPITFLFDQKKILVGDLNAEIANARTIDDLVFFEEDDFFIFQNMIREAVGQKIVNPPDPNMHPRKKRMLALQRLRDKVKAKQNAKEGLTFDNTLVAICCMGLGLNPLNIGELSYCALNSLIACYQNKEKYELDISSLLAGADSKKVHPKYWIRDLNE